LLLLLYLGCTTNWRNVPSGYSLQLLTSGASGFPSMFSRVASYSSGDAEESDDWGPGVFMAEEVD